MKNKIEQDLKKNPNYLNLRDLNLTGKELFLKDLKKFKSLEILEINNNNFECFDFLKDLKNLKLLNLYMCNIEDLSFLKNLNNIEGLNLSYNKIKNIECLKYLKNLRYIDLRKNFIKDISPLKNLKNLENVLIHMNYIKALDSSNLYLGAHLDGTKLTIQPYWHEYLERFKKMPSYVDIYNNIVKIQDSFLELLKNMINDEDLKDEDLEIKNKVKKYINEQNKKNN